MKSFVPLLLALSICTVADAKPAKQATPVAPHATVPMVTRDNFVSLEVRADYDHASGSTDVTVRNGGISFSSIPSFGVGSQTVRSGFLSNNQFGLLVRAINETRLPALAGEYKDKKMHSGVHATVTLIISDEANRDRTFTIVNYGSVAPRAYYTFLERMRKFVGLKFPAADISIWDLSAPLE
jgi:hypothetical protein